MKMTMVNSGQKGLNNLAGKGLKFKDFKMFGLKFNKFEILVIFSHLKLWIALKRHNFKCVKIKIVRRVRFPAGTRMLFQRWNDVEK